MTGRSPVIPDRARRTIAVDVVGVAGAAATVDAEHMLHVALTTDSAALRGLPQNSDSGATTTFRFKSLTFYPLLFAWPSHTPVQLQRNTEPPTSAAAPPLHPPPSAAAAKTAALVSNSFTLADIHGQRIAEDEPQGEQGRREGEAAAG